MNILTCRNTFIYSAWFLFFLSPLFWPKVLDSYIPMDLLALAAGLVAAALMSANAQGKQHPETWLMFGALIAPVAMHLIFLNVRDPWRIWQMGLYFTAAWLVFRMSAGQARILLGKIHWAAFLGMIGNLYVIFSLLQEFGVHPLPGFTSFPIWLESPERFGGPLIQPNMEGLFLCMVVATLWITANAEERYWPWLLSSLLPCAGVLATGSRSSALVLLAATVIIILASYGRTKAVLRLLAVVIPAVLVNELWSSFAVEPSLIDRVQSSGITPRLFIWDMSVRLFLAHPLLGIGPGNLPAYGVEAHLPTLMRHPEWGELANSYIGGHAWTHNVLLQFLVEAGIWGGITFLGLTAVLLFHAWRAYSLPNRLETGQFQAAVGIVIMLIHGMVSVALLQGFFLVLFSLYAAALVIQETGSEPGIRRSIAAWRHGVLLIPAICILGIWNHWIDKELGVEQAVSKPVKSDAFLIPVAEGIENPWISRLALQWYFAKLTLTHAPPRIWVGSKHYAYRLWFQYQNHLSLKYLILIAHLENDYLAEKRWVKLFTAAYPKEAVTSHFHQHIASGHVNREALDVWR